MVIFEEAVFVKSDAFDNAVVLLFMKEVFEWKMQKLL